MRLPSRRLAVRLAVVTTLVVAASAGAFAWRFDRAPSDLVMPGPGSVLLDRHGRFLGELPASDGDLGYWPPPADLPPRLVAATLAIEDRRFFSHSGVDLRAVVRAAWQDVTNLSIVSGASTVPMQLARMLHPAPRSLSAKVDEAFTAWKLVATHGHDAVLRAYLTLAPYGHRVHGAERAARYYFDRPLADLSWLQSAFLAGLPQQPGRFSPWTPRGRARALARARRIVGVLHAQGVITAEERDVALASDLGVVERPTRDPSALHPVLSWAAEARDLGGNRLETTLDLDLQKSLAAMLRRHVARLGSSDATNGAMVVIDTKTAEVLAWVGSANYFDEKDRGAIDFVRTRRSPGSTLKPFIYALALAEAGWTAATPVPDVPVEFAARDGVFLPENASHGFLGPMLVRQALANSRNIPALRALSAVGPDRLVTFLRAAGAPLPMTAARESGLSLALGAEPMTLEDVATAYVGLANEGKFRPIRRFKTAPAHEPDRLLPAAVAQELTHILSDDDARRPTFPPEGPLKFTHAVAAKTGTSEGERDAWTFAYSDRLLVGVWIGNHDQRQMHGLGGATAAAPLAHDAMELATATYRTFEPIPPVFPPPRGWSKADVCPISGGLAGPHCPHRRAEWFAPGTEPVEPCTAHRVVALDVRNGLRATPGCPDRVIERRVMLDLPREIAVHLRRSRESVAPTEESPLCPGAATTASLQVVEPLPDSRFRLDPETPPDAAGIRLAVVASRADEPVVWLVDGAPIAETRWPHELRWTPTPGAHEVRAAYARLAVASAPVSIVVHR